MTKIIQGLLVGVFIVALGIFGFRLYHNTRPVAVPETAIREPFVFIPPEPVEPEPTPEPVITAPTEPTYEPEPEPEPEPLILLPRIVALREQYNNPDIVGYIQIPNTTVSYPVAQTGNNEFYLYHNLQFERDGAGAIFVDYENDIFRLEDDNMIIFGHNMRRNHKFHAVRNFNRRDFFDTHTYILLTTPYRETVWDIFAFFPTTIHFDYLFTNFDTREDFYDFITILQEKSIHPRDMEVTTDDQLLILSTCTSGGSDDGRYIAIARLRPEATEYYTPDAYALDEYAEEQYP